MLANQLLYVTQSEVLVFAVFLYNMRLLERLLGPHKYASFIVLIYLLSAAVVPLVLAVLDHVPLLNSGKGGEQAHYAPPGPTAVVFGVLSVYRDLVPRVYQFQLTPSSSSSRSRSSPSQVLLSDKTFVYVLAADLALLRGTGSLVKAAVGWTLGGLIHSEAIPGKHWRVPFVGKKQRLQRQSMGRQSTGQTQQSSESSGPSATL